MYCRVFRLYPTRNVLTASGYPKIDSVQTDEQVFDATGNSLANVVTQFEDVTNRKHQNFIAIMNSIFSAVTFDPLAQQPLEVLHMTFIELIAQTTQRIENLQIK